MIDKITKWADSKIQEGIRYINKLFKDKRADTFYTTCHNCKGNCEFEYNDAAGEQQWSTCNVCDGTGQIKKSS
jgi:hypothetical protein